MKKSILYVSVFALALTACATKRYPISTPLSNTEIRLMDCKDLELEMARMEQIQLQITETAETDWRSVAGFLGDYGIGNAMAKSEAETALAKRRAAVRDAQVERDCASSF